MNIIILNINHNILATLTLNFPIDDTHSLQTNNAQVRTPPCTSIPASMHNLPCTSHTPLLTDDRYAKKSAPSRRLPKIRACGARRTKQGSHADPIITHSGGASFNWRALGLGALAERSLFQRGTLGREDFGSEACKSIFILLLLRRLEACGEGV
jgi:hypothetical protein